jgi:hypothetical protein
MPMLLQIRGYHLPGRVWQSHDEHYDNVHVGIQVGKEPRAGARRRRDVVVDDPNRRRHARRQARFSRSGGAGQAWRPVYLTQLGGRRRRRTFGMFLTDECGGPTCARLKPPALKLSPD